MKFSKQAILARFHKMPVIRFEDQQLTSFAGVIVFVALFQRLDLKARLKQCFQHLKGFPIFGPHRIVLVVIVHLLLGFRRLRDVDYYRDDPLVQRLLGLRRLPDVATISRALGAMDRKSVEQVRALSSALVVEGLEREQLARLTLDFDGSVVSTQGHAEGTAVGYNTKKKGARSYYNLFATVAQTGQFLDVLHRSGNVHDSKGAHEFMIDNFDRVRAAFPKVVLESRMDSAFFNQKTLTLMDLYGVECTVSVPFERFAVLKQMIESRRRWRHLDGERCYFESDWKPKSWPATYRFLFVRHQVRRQVKGPLQLDLFEPRDVDYDYRVVVTNKMGSARSVLLFHHGRGSQEGIFAEARQHAGLDLIPTRRLVGHQARYEKGSITMPMIDPSQIRAMHEALTPTQHGILKQERCLSDEVIDGYQIGVTMKYGDPRVTIPIPNAAGEFEDVRCWLHPRHRLNGSSKILHWAKGYGGSRLYPIGMLQNEELVLVAGELDALALISNGIVAITATAGESTWPNRLSEQIASSPPRRVTVLPDNDETGTKGAQMRAASLHAYGLEVRLASWE